MNIEAVLTDIGNVLLKVDLQRAEEFLKRRGVRVNEAEGKEVMKYAALYERGELGTGEFEEKCREILRLPIGGEVLVREAWNAVFQPDGLICETAEAYLKLQEKGVRVILFSNTNEAHIEYMKSKWGWLFDSIPDAVYSCRVHAMKPEAGMYEYALRTYGLTPQRVLYFDDKPENVAAGMALGIDAHVYDYNRPQETFFRFLPPR